MPEPKGGKAFSNQSQPKISIVIVNYNVKEYLAQALNSIKKALEGITHEIFIVDNASVDGSISYLEKNFSDVKIIQNQVNLGFGKANNQALKLAGGEFIVLINPDTVVQEDTFRELLMFFEKTPDAGAATCKIINPDGTFSIDCRHSIPTPSIAFWKVTGLSRIFPKSRIFGRYNLTYLDPDQSYAVPAISGSFMMIRKETLEAAGQFDERFFMYCEDIDLCHRINQIGFKIYYVPSSQIIHYKGESTKKDNLDYVITFNKSLYLFFKKYYAPGSIFLFRWLITIGIFFRAVVLYIKNFLRNNFPLLLDIAILNSATFLALFLRFGLASETFWQDFTRQFFVVNIFNTIVFLLISFYMDIYPGHRFSIQSVIKSNLVTFMLVASLTFFIKSFGFSRIVVLVTFFISPLFMISWRAILRRHFRGEKSAWGRDFFSKPTVVVGNGSDVRLLCDKLMARKEIDYDLVGWISIDEIPAGGKNGGDKRNLGTLENLKALLKMHRIRQVIFSTHSISYEEILRTMSSVSNSTIEYKMAPSNLDVIIGKSHIERLDDFPLLDIEYALNKRFNRFIKRFIDLCFSVMILTLTLPFFLIYLLFKHRKIETHYFVANKDSRIRNYRFSQTQPDSLPNSWLVLWQVVRGNLSLVGSPLREEVSPKENQYWYKPGLTGLIQLNQDKIQVPDDAEKYHLFYLKNQSTLLDFEIMLKAIWKYIFG